MLKYYFRITLLLLVLWPSVANSQELKELYLDAENFLEDENYYKALDKYQQVLEQDPNNANLNFKIGFCFLNTATMKVKAIPFLEYAVNYIVEDYREGDVSEIRAPFESKFYLGKAYHANYRFDDAEKIFLELKQQLDVEAEGDFIAMIDYELQTCQVARQLIKNPVEMTVSNLGRNINSVYDEHSPVISGDESLLIFTSKRESNVGNNKMDDGQYFEDIYLSSFDGKDYTMAKSISSNINTEGHEASIGLSFDGSKLFIYRDDEGNGNIYVSERNGSEWMVPEMLPSVVNSKYRETHASMSFDENEIFFTSDRKGGYGGLDIYRIRKLPNGNWSKAKNLGPNINTPYDEEGPYFHPDGTSLFFASKGHQTMGGFDIFVSFVDENDTWSIPQNVGYPINTPDDNIYYVPSVDGRRAYYSSYANNSMGLYDIFRIDLAESHRRNQTVIAGIAKTNRGKFLEDAIITISDEDDNVVAINTPNGDTKKFLIILPRGKRFLALVESSNHPDMLFELVVPEFSYDQSQQVVIFNEVVTLIGEEPEEEASVIAEVTPQEETGDSARVIESSDYEMEQDVDESELLASSGLIMEETGSDASIKTLDDDEVLKSEADPGELEAMMRPGTKQQEGGREPYDDNSIDGNHSGIVVGNELDGKAPASLDDSKNTKMIVIGALGVLAMLVFIRLRRKKN